MLNNCKHGEDMDVGDSIWRSERNKKVLIASYQCVWFKYDLYFYIGVVPTDISRAYSHAPSSKASSKVAPFI